MRNACRTLAVLCSISVDVSQVHAQSGTLEKLKLAQANMIVCAKVAIAALDDGISSAEIVGRAALSRCRAKERIVYAEAIKNKDTNWLKGFNQTYDPEGIFTGFVLSDRGRKRSAKKAAAQQAPDADQEAPMASVPGRVRGGAD